MRLTALGNSSFILLSKVEIGNAFIVNSGVYLRTSDNRVASLSTGESLIIDVDEKVHDIGPITKLTADNRPAKPPKRGSD